jgi:MoaA/NifB/PqqE/SkfB family radical SAM enzyme
MISRKSLTQWLSQESVDFTSSIVEQALLNDTLRGLVVKKLEKYLLAQLEAIATPGLPARVTQDKKDLALGLIRGVNLALERKQISRHVLRRLLRSLLTNTVLGQDKGAQAAFQGFVERHGKEPPVTMVISPTKACNLECVGCYASCAPGEDAPHLDWETFDRIITEAKTLWGMRFITISGGEPFTYRSLGKDLVDMFAKHEDCFFQVYTNGTLFGERMANRMAEVGNMVPAISVEGFEAITDERRGAGVFQRVLKGMANLRQAGVPFGISLTATHFNVEEILSDEFLDFFFDEQQAIFGWIFQYMPIGRAYTLDLLVTPEQRAWMWQRSWEVVRERKLLLADFWNLATASDGCISAAKPAGYLYIDWHGKIMPCVFVPYSAANVHDVYREGKTLDDIYDLPFFKAIREWQVDYFFGDGGRLGKHNNWLMPCPLRDHHHVGRTLIDTYHVEPEDESAAQALQDGNYYEGMMAYNEEMHKALDPVWEEAYLDSGNGGSERVTADVRAV